MGDGVGRGLAVGHSLRSCRSAFSWSSASSSFKKLSCSVLSVYIPTASSRISSCICSTSSSVNGGSSSSPSARGTSSISRSSERSLGSSSVAGAQDADLRAGDSSSAMLGWDLIDETRSEGGRKRAPACELSNVATTFVTGVSFLLL